MLNVKSRFDKGFIKYENLFQYIKKWNRKVGIIMNANLVDLYEIKSVLGNNMPVVGLRKEYDLNGQCFNLVFYPKTKIATKVIMQIANFQKGSIEDLKLIKEVKVVIESEDVNPQIATLLEGFGVLKRDIYYGVKSEIQLEKLNDYPQLQSVDFREVGYLDYQEDEKYEEFFGILKIEGEKGISEYEFFSNKLIGEKDKSKELMKDLADWEVYRTDRVHLPDLKNVKNFAPSRAFYEILGEEVIASIPKEDIGSAAYLFDLSVKATVEQYGTGNVEVFKMMLGQLKLVYKKKYQKYFLIVRRILEICEENNIKRGRGRGSVVGYLLSKILGITTIDPLKYELLPERFINEERMDNVDIDIDVSQKDREKLLSLLVKEFGSEYVAQVMTQNKLGFKNALKEYLKKHVVNPNRMRELNALKPESFNGLEEFLKNDEAKELYGKSKDIRNVLEVCYEAKDATKSASKHAAAIIISDVPIKSIVPTVEGDNGVLIAQFIPADSGLIKIDLLGLKTVDVIEGTKQMIIDMYPEHANHPKLEVDFNDEKTIDLYKRGKLIGVFQMEGMFARKSAIEMGITSLDDVIALNAMNRPGPKDFIPIYAERKKDESKAWFEQGNLVVNKICEDTYGIIVYQEQINKIAMIYAGYSAGEAEMFRRAVSKKDSEKLMKERANFVSKAISNGRNEEEAISVYDHIEKFADYGFNKSHSVAYGETSFVTAYYKANFPLQFMTVLLNSVIDDRKKLEIYLNEVMEMNIPLLGVDINKSSVEFLIEGNSIRMPFQVVSGIGEKLTKPFVMLRNKENSYFNNIQEYLDFAKVNSVELPKLEELIKVGVFDYSGVSRSDLLSQMTSKKIEMTISDEINAEKSLQYVVLNKNAGKYLKYLETAKTKSDVYKFGEVVSLEIVKDKKEREMAKIKLSKSNGYVDKLVIFHNDWNRLKELVQINETYLIKFVDKNVIKEISKIE